MKKVIGIVVGALVCSLAPTALADLSTERLRSVGVGENQAFLWTVGPWDGTTCSDMGVGIIDTTTESGRLMYQTALAAYLAGQEVRGYYYSCIGSHPKITRVEISE